MYILNDFWEEWSTIYACWQEKKERKKGGIKAGYFYFFSLWVWSLTRIGLDSSEQMCDMPGGNEAWFGASSFHCWMHSLLPFLLHIIQCEAWKSGLSCVSGKMERSPVAGTFRNQKGEPGRRCCKESSPHTSTIPSTYATPVSTSCWGYCNWREPSGGTHPISVGNLPLFVCLYVPVSVPSLGLTCPI